jgi:hypothetical protein
MARIALAMLTMRVNTPVGHWVEETFGQAYYDLWDDAHAIAGGQAEEDLFLLMMNMASYYLQALAITEGRPVEAYLEENRREIDALRFSDDDEGDAP